jgi:Holliday junction DNA helicase RuvA
MYAHIEGIVSEKAQDAIVLDVHGVGYLLMVSAATLAIAPAAGEKLKLYTILNVRDDALELFGFYSREEKGMYERLRSVSGVGPRTALSILSALSVREISIALVTGDANALTRAPGIGKKTAQRLVLELKDKVADAELAGTDISPAAAAQNGPEAEAIAALISLGYASAEAARAVSRFAGQTDKADELIFLALKGLG